MVLTLLISAPLEGESSYINYIENYSVLHQFISVELMLFSINGRH